MTEAHAYVLDKELRKLPVTIKVTMSREDWKIIRAHLDDQSRAQHYETSQLNNAIRDVLTQLDKVYSYYTEDEPERTGEAN